MKFCNYFLFLQLEPLLTLALSFNYIVNGGFEDQVVPPSSYISNNLTRWNGSNFDLTNMYSTLGYNQYIDLQ